MLNVPIQPVKIQIRGLLRCEISDGHSHIIQALISWAIVNACALRQAKRQFRVINDRAHQPQKPFLVAYIFVDAHDYLVIHAIEILTDVAFDDCPISRVWLSIDKPNPIQ